MNLYADYIKERENLEILETEHSFITYRIESNGVLFISDAYVVPEKRHTGFIKEQFNKLVKDTKVNSIVTLTDDNAFGIHISKQVIYNLGFKPFKKIESIQYYIMEINNG